MFIFIISIVIIVLLAVIFFVSASRDMVKQAQNANPIDNIYFGGLMGFRLGDGYKFCLSRLKHLKLPINKNDFEDEVYKMGLSSYRHQYVVWGRNEFNNVKDVTFAFKDKRLCSITVDIDYTKDGIRDMYGILVSRISRVLEDEPKFSLKDFTSWDSPLGVICLAVYQEKTGNELNIQILPK
jgi:hypothetical protein